jgi:hypothetical protein
MEVSQTGNRSAQFTSLMVEHELKDASPPPSHLEMSKPQEAALSLSWIHSRELGSSPCRIKQGTSPEKALASAYRRTSRRSDATLFSTIFAAASFYTKKRQNRPWRHRARRKLC